MLGRSDDPIACMIGRLVGGILHADGAGINTIAA
jgi:hypothetical protein